MKDAPVSKRRRFEVFNRDGFVCQYCGKSPPAVMLHVDHIIPKSKGGSNDPENLRTSCAECNMGKSDKPIMDAGSVDDDRQRAQEAMEAISFAKVFAKAKKAREKTRQDAVNYICTLLGSSEVRRSTASSYIIAMDRFGIAQATVWLDYAVSRTTNYSGRTNETNAMKYFHGIIRRTAEQEELVS